MQEAGWTRREARDNHLRTNLAHKQPMPKPSRIATRAHLGKAVAHLLAADKRLHPVMKRAGELPFRSRREEGFEALVSIVVSQQLSVAAADTIFGRVKEKVAPFAPAELLATARRDLARLRAVGAQAEAHEDPSPWPSWTVRSTSSACAACRTRTRARI